MKYPIKVLLDEKKQPFLPFTTTECVLVDGTDQTMTEYLNAFVAEKNQEIQEIIAELEQYTEQRMSDLDRIVNNKITEVNNKLTEMENKIDSSVTNMEQNIDNNTLSMVKHIEEETAALDARLAAKEAELDKSVETMVTYRDETTTNVNSLETEVEGMRVDLGYAQEDLAALTTLDGEATE